MPEAVFARTCLAVIFKMRHLKMLEVNEKRQPKTGFFRKIKNKKIALKC
jgi:hypothetical protein